MNALVQTTNAEAYRASTDAADLCKGIVVASAMVIQDRKYVKVEGWQAIAIAHGCTGSARDVERVPGGVRAIGEVRRMSDGAVIAEAEGFVGEDEPTWFGGEVEKDEWTGPKGNRHKTGKKIVQTMPKRPDYAIRAMAQTRAISRACRSAFAHVVVMMNAGLSTTPAEEVPVEGFDTDREPMRNVTPPRDQPRNPTEEPKTPTAGKKSSAAVVAAKNAILSTPTEILNEGWLEVNEPALRELSNEDYNEVVAFLKATIKPYVRAESLADQVMA